MTTASYSPTERAVAVPARTKWLNPELRWTLSLVTAIFAGAALAAALAGPLFRLIPHDRQRSRTLLRALEAAPSDLHAVVLGSSVAMNGIDARVLAQRAGWSGTSYNLGSSGQMLAESFLYYQELPRSVAVVVHLIYPTETEGEGWFSSDVFNTLYLYGYHPLQQTSTALRQIYGDQANIVLNQDALGVAFASRWALRQWLDSSVRKLVRRDLLIERSIADWNYPAPYTHPVSHANLLKHLDKWNRKPDRGCFREGSAFEPLIARLARTNRSNGRTTVLVWAPVHPLLQQRYKTCFFQSLATESQKLTRDTGVIVLDASRLLNANEFVDAVHPTRDGALALSTYVGEQLAAARGR